MRSGWQRQETVSHVPQACLTTHAEGIARHNAAQGKVVTVARRNGCDTSAVRHIIGRDGCMLKADLILAKRNRGIVCDIDIH
uniref:Uncharacterized protein n=1 Tax=Glossina palpalis gambiensis TaxID=67801 RepID=A0A1B0AN25_9MUSC